MGDRAAIAVMARSPARAPETIKTRLAGCVPDSSDRRRLYLAFLQDTWAACRGVAGAVRRLAYTPADAGGDFTALDVAPSERLAQRGADLGARERAIFEDLFAEGFRRVVVIGSDLPTLPGGRLEQALRLLAAPADGSAAPPGVVLGPAADGGYFLIGLRAPAPGRGMPDLFTRIRWSTPHALEDTYRAALEEELEVQVLEPWFDVDDREGLDRLIATLGAAPAGHPGEATRQALLELGLLSSHD